MLPYAEFLTIFLFMSSAVGMLVSIALVCFNNSQRHANRLLGFSLLSVVYFSIVSALLVNHGVGEVPHLFRTAAPFQYLIAPCAYLYMRAVLYRESRFRRYDWLHFIPFFLHIVELMPFFWQSAEAKRLYMQQLGPMGVVKQAEGWLPAYYHPVLKFALGTAYVFLQWRLLGRFRRRHHEPEKQVVLRWLKTFTVMNTLLYPPILFAMLLPLQADSVLIFSIFTWSSYLLITASVLFFSPRILFGLAEEAQPSESAASAPGPPREEPLKNNVLSAGKREQYQQILETYMSQQRPFLRKGYTIRELAAECGIPQHQLSALINQAYGMNFSDFINRYRIEYIKEKIRQPEWRQLTLEGLALEAGFTNRTTFFRAFTKLTGTTPSEYVAHYQATA